MAETTLTPFVKKQVAFISTAVKNNKRVGAPLQAADRFIPRRGDSVDGDAKAFLQMESSYSMSIDPDEVEERKDQTPLLNLSIDSSEMKKQNRKHKKNVIAAMINQKAV